jgi:hypothetical protein
VGRRPRGQPAGVDPAQAPPDDADALAVLVGQSADQARQLVDHLLRGSAVPPECPARHRIAEAAQPDPQRARRDVGGEQAGQDQHGMRLAPRRAPQQRQPGGERAEAGQRAGGFGQRQQRSP